MNHSAAHDDEDTSEEEQASDATEDDPQVPAPQRESTPAPAPGPSTSGAGPSAGRERPNYELRHVLRGHSQSISSVKFSPDGTLLASCGEQCSLLVRCFP